MLFFDFLSYWFKFNFVKNAFISIIILSILLGLMGTMVVHNRMSFFSDAIGHCTFTGIAIGTIVGIGNYGVSSVLFSIVLSLVISYVIESEKSSSDTIIGVFSSIGLSLGILMFSMNGGVSKYSEFLVGDILSIKKSEIWFLLSLLVISLIFWIFLFNKFLVSSLSKDLAVSKRIDFMTYKTLFAILVSVVVSLAIKWVGILIINSLITLPAAAARNLSKGMRKYHFFTILFSLFSGIAGLMLSLKLKTPAGPTIVMVCALVFIITFVYNHRKV